MSRWQLVPASSPERMSALAQYPRVLAGILANREITTAEDAERFMHPDFTRDVHDPFLFRQMRAACERVFAAIAAGETVAIHGDYDADGISGSVLLTGVLRFLWQAKGGDTSKITNYHPHRENDGYGIRTATMDAFAQRGVTLMITVDCGISCAPEIAYATTKGIDTIVVDHHEFDPEKLPQCILLHPRLPEEVYPFKYLAAVGVAYKFACGLLAHAREQGVEVPPGYEKWLLDLVAIATVTDMVPLVGENRVLEKYGLMVLNKTRRTGLRALIEVSGLSFGALDTMSVGFGIGPRINAASRMDHADVAVRTLLADDADEARVYAEQLNDLNKARQKYTEEIYAAAKRQAKALGDKKVFVIKGEGWSAGIVGLVAGKLLNEFGKPVYVLGQEGEKMVGSGRAPLPINTGGVRFNVVTAMERAAKHLARFGGHPQACGLTIMGEENFVAFAEIVDAYAEELFGETMPEAVVEIDAEVRIPDITLSLVELVERMAPFGEGNRTPRFLLRDAVVSEVREVGKTGSHVQVFLYDAHGGMSMGSVKAIGFFMAEKLKEFPSGTAADLVVELGVNEWKGTRSPQVKIIDIAFAGTMIAEQKTSPAVAMSHAL